MSKKEHIATLFFPSCQPSCFRRPCLSRPWRSSRRGLVSGIRRVIMGREDREKYQVTAVRWEALATQLVTCSLYKPGLYWQVPTRLSNHLSVNPQLFSVISVIKKKGLEEVCQIVDWDCFYINGLQTFWTHSPTSKKKFELILPIF